MRSSQVAPPTGPRDVSLLRAIAQGRVSRCVKNGRGGMWSVYLLDGYVECGVPVRRLHRLDLLSCPIQGPPVITDDGWEAISDLDMTDPSKAT